LVSTLRVLGNVLNLCFLLTCQPYGFRQLNSENILNEVLRGNFNKEKMGILRRLYEKFKTELWFIIILGLIIGFPRLFYLIKYTHNPPVDVLTTCHIYDVNGGISSTILIYYEYEVKGYIYRKSIKMNRRFYRKKIASDMIFPLIYRQDEPNVSQPLLLPEAIQKYYGHVPDSLAWIKTYFCD
jgi:hypothetical protein